MINDKRSCPKKQNLSLPDASVFAVSFVPLELRTSTFIAWTNPIPSSVHYCRLVKFSFIKETDAIVKKEYHYYTTLLEKVETYTIKVDDITFEVSFDLKCIMIDGKVCNYLTGNRASRCCNICGIGHKFVNDVLHVKKRSCKKRSL